MDVVELGFEILPGTGAGHLSPYLDEFAQEPPGDPPEAETPPRWVLPGGLGGRGARTFAAIGRGRMKTMTAVPIAARRPHLAEHGPPTNLMVVNGLMWFDDEPDWDAVRGSCAAACRGGSRCCTGGRGRRGGWVWEDDPDFDVDRHVRR